MQAMNKLQPGEAHAAVLDFKPDSIDRGLSPSSVNLRLNAIRKAVKTARQFGLITWTIDVELVPTLSYRDTRGPGSEAIVGVIRSLGNQQGAKAARDCAWPR